MIATIFNKSKPIHLILALFFVGISGVIAQVQFFINETHPISFSRISAIGVAIISTVLVAFMVKKYSLTNQNSFVLLYYALFFMIFWNTDQVLPLLCSQVCVLLALRKIISLKNQKNNTQKIFDAAFWISIASLFHFWTILFIVVLYVAILFYVADYYKNWLVPLVAIFVVWIIKITYQGVFLGEGFQIALPVIETTLEQFVTNKNITILSFFGAIALVSIAFLRKNIQQKRQQQKLTPILLLVTFFIAIAVGALSLEKGISMLLFLYFPLAVLFSMVLEKITKQWLQELIVYGSVFFLILSSIA